MCVPPGTRADTSEPLPTTSGRAPSLGGIGTLGVATQATAVQSVLGYRVAKHPFATGRFSCDIWFCQFRIDGSGGSAALATDATLSATITAQSEYKTFLMAVQPPYEPRLVAPRRRHSL